MHEKREELHSKATLSMQAHDYVYPPSVNFSKHFVSLVSIELIIYFVYMG